MIADYIHAFPLTPLGGCFFVGVGLGVIAGAVLPRLRMRLVGAGFLIGILLIYAGVKPLSAGIPAAHPFAAWSIIVAIIVEVLAFRLIMPRVRLKGERSAAIASLAIVSGHFFLMVPAFGFLIAILGLVGFVNLWRGWKRPETSLDQIWLVDGLAKLLFGIGMIATAPVFT